MLEEQKDVGAWTGQRMTPNSQYVVAGERPTLPTATPGKPNPVQTRSINALCEV